MNNTTQTITSSSSAIDTHDDVALLNEILKPSSSASSNADADHNADQVVPLPIDFNTGRHRVQISEYQFRDFVCILLIKM